jgi:hypothetical protein
MIQLIENKPLIVRVNNLTLHFKRPYYFVDCDNFKTYKAVIKGSQLAWNIKGFQFTYNQIKNLHENTNQQKSIE